MIQKSDIVYIAGPMTGKPLFNYPVFYGMSGLIEKEYKCTVLNPARQPNGLKYEEYMRRAMEDIDRSTIVVFLHNWEQSSGANREYARAVQRDIRILMQDEIENDIEQKLQNIEQAI